MSTKRLGKRLPKLDHRTLRLSRYLPTLSPPPAAIDHASKIAPPVGMMGNDSYGDCVVAAAAHMRQSWTAYSLAGQSRPTDPEIIAAYLTLSPRDEGLFPLDWLNYWRKTGLAGDKIEAYVATDVTLVQAKLAIQMFGSHFVGLALPDTNTFGPWDVPRPPWPANPWNGHMVNLVAYDDARAMFRAITWGEVIDMSYGWFLAYVDECYAVLNDIMLIQESGRSPEGFDWPRLETDLAAINDPTIPDDPVVIVPPAPIPPEPNPDPWWCFTPKSLRHIFRR